MGCNIPNWQDERRVILLSATWNHIRDYEVTVQLKGESWTVACFQMKTIKASKWFILSNRCYAAK